MENITIATRDELAPQLLMSMHEFRRQVFVGRLGWSLPMLDGTEQDEYDGAQTTYLTVADGEQQITGCARLLPTTGRYMLPEIFPELLGERPVPCDPAIWELSRFATSVRSTGEGRVLSLSRPTLDLLDSILAHAGRRGCERLLLVTSIAIERLLLRAGVHVHRLAAPARSHGALYVALFIEVPAHFRRS